MATSLLAHLAGPIAQKENLATEALAFILGRSTAARQEFARQVTGAVGAPVEVARVATQVAVSEESRPDLVLFDAKGVTGFVEAKFWAALTAAQPVKYLRRLATSSGSALVLLAPKKRLPLLRLEVLERCRSAAMSIEDREGVLRVDGVSVGFLSWAGVLDGLRAAAAEEPATLSDLGQLAGLCARLDAEGFLPFTREDLSDLDVPRLVLALARIVEDVVELAVKQGLVSTKGLRAAHSLGRTGRYVAFARAGCWIGLSHWAWADRGSPLWLRFGQGSWGRAADLRAALRPWSVLVPPRAFVDEEGGNVYVPVALRVGVEKDIVVEDVVRQLRELDGLMAAANLPPLSGAPPTEG